MNFNKDISAALALDYGKTAENATTFELYNSISKAAVKAVKAKWQKNTADNKREVCYLSAEFLIGRLINANLLNMNAQQSVAEFLKAGGSDIAALEEVEDAALGNGGLGRLAACFLDSGASIGIKLNGYGIRYRYGLFKQQLADGFQTEVEDDWLKWGDPWSVRREDERVRVDFKDQSVWAVPYDTPVIGYGCKRVNNLRLWQSEPLREFDFARFDAMQYDEAVKQRNDAQKISSLLYPNDWGREGKILRLKQEYFFSSASLQDMVRRYKLTHSDGFKAFADLYAVQLNDTHPVVAIPELIRLLTAEGLNFKKAFDIAKNTFNYTNHTVMGEALEKWDAKLFKAVIPEVYAVVLKINNLLKKELKAKNIVGEALKDFAVIDGGVIHMARLAVYATLHTNGVAAIHSQILKDDLFNNWYKIYPERFGNKTNGITQRRWLALANPELAKFITKRIGTGWLTNLDELKKLEPCAKNHDDMREFAEIKLAGKRRLAEYIKRTEGAEIPADFIFDIQVKRIHEYKRQMLNALSVLDIYFGLKEGRIKEFYPTAFLFGGKAMPSYYRAKGIIKLICEVARLVNNDPDPRVKGKLIVHFMNNYNVSYAEKIMPAADVSEQISTAGTEASGTGNMKFMLNGAVTLGTMDGANVEIVEQAGEENNYIFGARVEDIAKIKDSYDPKKLMKKNKRIKKAVSALIDGTLNDGGTGMFKELYDSLTVGASWHKPDHYYLLLDLIPYCDKKLELNRDYAQNKEAFTVKCFMNTVNAGTFSSDRTIRQYAKDIWKTK